MMRNKVNAMQAGKTLDSLLSAFSKRGIIEPMTPNEIENKITSMSNELALFQLNELKRNEELKIQIETLINDLKKTNDRITRFSTDFFSYKESTYKTLDWITKEVQELYVAKEMTEFKNLRKAAPKWKFW